VTKISVFISFADANIYTFHYFAKQNTKNFTLFFYADIYFPKNYPHTLIYKYSKQPPFATYLVALLRKKLHPKSKKE